MYRRRSYSADPRWLVARFAGSCSGCKAPIKAGEDVFYYPNGKRVFGKACGCADRNAADFEAHAADEAFMSGGY